MAPKGTQFLLFSAKMCYFDLKLPIFIKLNPFMTFLIKVMLINLTKIAFETVLRKKYVCRTPKFRPMAAFLPPRWSNLDHFHPKCPCFTKLTPLMILLTNVIIINLTEIIFETVLGKKIVSSHPKISTYDVILVPKWPNFDHFHQRLPILTELTPLMTF